MTTDRPPCVNKRAIEAPAFVSSLSRGREGGSDWRAARPPRVSARLVTRESAARTYYMRACVACLRLDIRRVRSSIVSRCFTRSFFVWATVAEGRERSNTPPKWETGAHSFTARSARTTPKCYRWDERLLVQTRDKRQRVGCLNRKSA